MAILPIRIYPDPVLRARCVEVEDFGDELRRLAEDLVETMYSAPGVGLAAPQIGVEKRLAVVDVTVGKNPEALHFLVNPRILDQHGREIDSEGCLSIPGISEKVARPRAIVVQAQNLDGEQVEIEASEFEARAICHEIDHLAGVLFVDHLRGLRRDRARRHLRKLKRRRNAPAPASEVAAAC